MSDLRFLLELDDDERRIRNDTIEECAFIVELKMKYGRHRSRGEEIAAAIRALKDKP